MASLRPSFEKELKQKLSQKSTNFHTEETVLLKAFKYFDLQQSGFVDKNQFIRVVEKLGLPVYNPDDYYQLFQYYDVEQRGQLNYKQFIGSVFGNATSTTRQESPSRSYQKTTSQFYRGYTAQDSVLKLQKNLQDSRYGILELANIFSSKDQDSSKKIELQNFLVSLQEANLSIDQQEAQEIFSYFDKQRQGFIRYDEFLQGIRGPLSNNRKELIKTAFVGLDRNQTSVVPVEAVRSNYNGRLHPDVRVGKKN